MAGRTIRAPPKLSALACALFEDNGRYFFLEKIDERGRKQIELPSVLVNEGDDPVSSLSSYLRSSLSLDSQIHLISLRGKFNAGSRKRRRMIPVLAFRCSAKRMQPKLPAAYSGFRWLAAEDSLKEKLGRNSEWLMRAERV
ncbi:MAG: hypothetical protein M1530_03625 [Candidatus Marsarchaeota archaeon]|nr:hypothetical protein [Candidatus Marsarchaeota archaeon]